MCYFNITQLFLVYTRQISVFTKHGGCFWKFNTTIDLGLGVWPVFNLLPYWVLMFRVLDVISNLLYKVFVSTSFWF
jgi:hypothetical protein